RRHHGREGDRTKPKQRAPHYAHHFAGLARKFAAFSKAELTANTLSSSSALPITCKPSGNPFASVAAGKAMAGKPARFAVTVKMSFKYIATGSALFSPSAN